MLFRYKIPHVTYCKLNTGISNELASHHECTISGDFKNKASENAYVNGENEYLNDK